MDWVNTGAVGDIASSNHSRGNPTVDVTVRSAGKVHHTLSQENNSLHSRRVKGLSHRTVWGALWPNNDCSALDMGFALVHPLQNTGWCPLTARGHFFPEADWQSTHHASRSFELLCTTLMYAKKERGVENFSHSHRQEGKHNKNNLEYKWIKVTNQLI